MLCSFSSLRLNTYIDMSNYLQSNVTKVTTHVLQNMKQSGEKIAMLTAYDYSMARLLNDTKIDVVLVGDSAANVMAGHETTLPITIDQMIYHAQSVMRAVKNPLVVCDMPFGTYQGNPKEAVRSAIRIMKESEVDAVKLEGGSEIMESVERILSTGIPVMGHLGLMPQSINKYGTYGSGGAYRDPLSPYRSWYRFRSYPDRYDSWWGFDTLPEVNENFEFDPSLATHLSFSRLYPIVSPHQK